MPQFFIDSTGALSNMRRTPQGGFLVDATLAKVGVMSYAKGSELIRRFNPAETLAAHAADAAVAPVTFKHPPKFVDVHSYQKLACGHVVGTPTFADGHIRATLAIQDAGLIRAIEMGEAREVSMGYTAHHDMTPGVTESGEHYDERRIKIEWNHIAVVPAGRAGKSVRLMLDSDEIPEMETDMKLKINGVEVDVSAAQDAVDSYVAGLLAQAADLTKQADELNVKLKAAEAQLATAQSDEAFDAAFKVREEKRAAEKAKSEKRERVAKGYPAISLDNQSDAFIDGLDAALSARVAAAVIKDPDGLSSVQTDESGSKPANLIKAEDKREPKVRILSARQKMLADNAKVAKLPVGGKQVSEDSVTE